MFVEADDLIFRQAAGFLILGLDRIHDLGIGDPDADLLVGEVPQGGLELVGARGVAAGDGQGGGEKYGFEFHGVPPLHNTDQEK